MTNLFFRGLDAVAGRFIGWCGDRDDEAGKVNCVVVYKVDRLSSSLMDFARILEVFERNQVAFVSVTQQFNTTYSGGSA